MPIGLDVGQGGTGGGLADLSVSGKLTLTGVQNNTSVGTQDDFATTAGVTELRWNGASTATLDGLTNGADGRILIITNISTTIALTLANEAAGSAAANRMTLANGVAFVIAPGASKTLRYDLASLRWRPIDTANANLTVQQFTNTVINPTGINGTLDDWAPTGIGSATTVVVTTSGVTTLNGIVGGVNGRRLTLVNDPASTNAITVTSNTGTTAANRIATAGAVSWTLPIGSSMELIYSSVNSRWDQVVQTLVAGAGLTNAGGAISVTAAGIGPTQLANTAVAAASYVDPKLTIDAQGRITSATDKLASGSPDGSVTGTAGQLYSDSTTGVLWENVDSATRWVPFDVPARSGWFIFDDCLGTVNLVSAALGAGTNTISGEPAQPGLNTATVTVGGTDGVFYRWNSTLAINTFGGGIFTSTTSLRIATLSDATNNIIVRTGAHDASTVGDAVDGVYLEYDFGTHANHNWWLCTSNNSTRTKSDTGIVAVASSTVCQALEITVNGAGTVASAKINGVAAAGTVTTNIPTTSARVFGPVSTLVYKQLGAAGVLTATIDWVRAYQILTTPRAT